MLIIGRMMDYWTLTDPSIGINRFYAFYTDGTTILGNSCYYQINKSTGTWSQCFSLSGSKTSPTPDNIFDRQEDLMIDQIDQEELLLENTTAAPIDDDTRDKYLQSKNAIDKGSASPE